MTMQANLTNRDATLMPLPIVKWSYEVPRAEDVPAALGRATHMAGLAPRGPTFVSIPMDDWYADVDDDAVAHAIERSVSGRAAAGPDDVRALARALEEAKSPVLVAGPDIDASGGWDKAIALAERQRLPVYAIPAPGGGRIGFPESHPNFQGVLPPAIAPLSQTLEGHDLVLVVGASVFSYYPYIPGPLLPEGTRLVAITSDPDEAARAPMGDAIVADVALTLEWVLHHVGEAERDAPPERPPPDEPPKSDPMSGTEAMRALARAWPDDGVAVVETPSSTAALRNQLRISRPGSYYFSAGGGLGYGLPAAVGVQLAEPDRPVVCVIGEGSVQYAVSALYTAAAYEVPLTILVLRNTEYAILKWFAEFEQVEGAPGLDLPALNTAEIADGYGISSRRVEGSEELEAAMREAIGSPRPELVEVGVAPGMWLA
jgi:benzoylformate decarboxylase